MIEARNMPQVKTANSHLQFMATVPLMNLQ